MSQTIIDLVTIVFPSVFSVISFSAIVACLKALLDLRKLRREILAAKKDEEVKEEIRVVLEENAELKKKLNECMTMIDHVERKD